NGDGALTTLVGAEHRGLELLSGARLDLLEREPPLAPHAPQSPAELACVVALGGLDARLHRLVASGQQPRDAVQVHALERHRVTSTVRPPALTLPFPPPRPAPVAGPAARR